MNITVYLGASSGNDPNLKTAVTELGAWIGQSGNTLIYGGSKSGLMGAIADSVLAANGMVIGIEPQFFIDDEVQHTGLTELIVTENMAQRKAKLIEYGEAFITFPGGTGTLEEVSEVMSMLALKHLNAPCVIYNLNGYYDSFREMLRKMVDTELCTDEKLKNVFFAENLEQIKEIIANFFDSKNRETV